MRERHVRLAAFGACCLGGAMLLTAGPIDPPLGPVQSTQKALDDVEPRTPLTSEFVSGNSSSVFFISAPGHYYLTGDVFIPSGQTGIVIGADNVTVDLNGYSVRALAGSNDGIATSGARNSPVIRNGLINAVNVGIRIAPSSRGVIIEDIVITGAGDDGIRGSADMTVRRCNILSQRDGIDVAGRCTIEDNIVTAFDDGITGGNEMVVRGNRVRSGVDGTGDAIDVGSDSVIERNFVTQQNDVGTGIRALLSTVANNEVRNANTGIEAGGRIMDNAVHNCGTGISIFSGLASGNVVNNVNNVGISANSARVEGNSINVLAGNAIVGAGQATILNNTVTGDANGGTNGVVLTGTYATIEGNTFVQLGAAVTVSDNRRAFIRGNTAINCNDAFTSVSTTGNVLAPVETLNAASTTITSTSPHTNFDYQ